MSSITKLFILILLLSPGLFMSYYYSDSNTSVDYSLKAWYARLDLLPLRESSINQDFPGLSEKSKNIIDLAVKNKDESLCVSKHFYDQNKCYIEVAVAKKDKRICEKVEERERWRCYERVAIKTGDESLCLTIKDNTFKNHCLSMVVGLLGEDSKCKWLDSYKDKCLIYAAIRKNDAKICNQVNKYSNDNINNCINWIAVQNGDEKICEVHQNQYGIDACLYKMASKKRDIKICSSIKDVRLKNFCLKIFHPINSREYIFYNLLKDAKFIAIITYFILSIMISFISFLLAQLVYNGREIKDYSKRISVSMVALYDHLIFFFLFLIYYLLFSTSIGFPWQEWPIASLSLHFLTMPFFVWYFCKHNEDNKEKAIFIYLFYVLINVLIYIWSIILFFLVLVSVLYILTILGIDISIGPW